MKENSDQKQLESDCVPSYSPMVNVRNVLLEMRDSSDPAVVEFAKRLSDAFARDCYCQICGRILKDQPIRNCDVGTVEEQCGRMAKFCSKQYEKSIGIDLCNACPLYGMDCSLAWAQMPYEKEKGDAK